MVEILIFFSAEGPLLITLPNTETFLPSTTTSFTQVCTGCSHNYRCFFRICEIDVWVDQYWELRILRAYAILTNLATTIIAVQNWNISSHLWYSRNENKTQPMISLQNLPWTILPFRNPHAGTQSSITTNRSCVSLAFYNVYWGSVDLYISNPDAKGLLSRNVLTTISILTSFGHEGRVLGNVATETTVLAATLPPDHSQRRPFCSSEADGCGQCGTVEESVQLIHWPVSTYSGSPDSVVSGTVNRSISIVSNSTTLILPSVYLSYQKVWTSENFC